MGVTNAQLKDILETIMTGAEERFGRIDNRLDKMDGRLAELHDVREKVILAKQWQEYHEANHHKHIDEALKKLGARQETQGEKISHLIGEVGKYGVLIFLIIDLVMKFVKP